MIEIGETSKEKQTNIIKTMSHVELNNFMKGQYKGLVHKELNNINKKKKNNKTQVNEIVRCLANVLDSEVTSISKIRSHVRLSMSAARASD